MLQLLACPLFLTQGSCTACLVVLGYPSVTEPQRSLISAALHKSSNLNSSPSNKQQAVNVI